MDLASPLRSIAPGLDSAVLQALAGTYSGLSASQIARLAPRGSRAGQLPVLNRPVEHGLVLADRANQGYLYRLNRDHVLAEPVLAAVGARAAVLGRLSEAVGALRPEPVHGSVFGSFARGDGGPGSDIDLLLMTAGEPGLDDWWSGQVQALADRVLAWTGNRLEHLVLSLPRLAEVVRAGEPIVGSWLQDAQVVHGPTLQVLVRQASGDLDAARAAG